ncbi:hypothetical protein MMC18_009037 [Xylographa bjoerkii]|nr:hypothetical protein [Xylographa bjoerkii]
MVKSAAMIFKAVHEGPTVPGQDIDVETSEFDLDQELPQGSLIIQNLFASFDPFMRGRMRAKTVLPAFIIGAPLPSTCVGQVLRSTSEAFKTGDQVRGYFSIAQYLLLTPDLIAPSQLERLDNQHNFDPTVFLGVLGMPGLAAYSSFYDIGKPKRGETIFISAAAGAVGQFVGQLAKHEGLTVIGSTGSDEKLDFLVQKLGFDAGFNYKKEGASEALTRLAPTGIDIYYENVGGEQLDAALLAMKPFGRIVGSGMMSQYNKSQEEKYGVKNLFLVIARRLTMRGFLVNDANMGPVYAKEFGERVAQWLHEGKFVSKVSVTEGIANGPEGFVGMLQGKNLGKAVLRL